MGTTSTTGSSAEATTFHSADLNVSIHGKIVSQKSPGETEGTVFELDEGSDAVQIKHPQLVTVSTKPESQTLRSINTGQPLFTLDTPLLPTNNSKLATDSEDPDEEEDSTSTNGSSGKKRTVTLHSGLIPSHQLNISATQSSPLFSQTFQILIDGPSFPPPRFDPASLAPPTPSFRPVDPSSTSASNFPGVLNSPTLQRALLSPLLSPQRRAASQGSDMSVPPLSLGLSRTSRASFSTDNRPLRPNATPSQPSGLLALVPSLLPSQQSSGQSSTNPSSSPSVSATQTPPTHSTDPTSLASTLTASMSNSAKKTAEDILSLRRSHDAFIRRAKAELEVLELRIEGVRNGASGGGVVGGGGVVRGFGVPVVVREGASSAQGGRDSRSGSESRERGRSAGRTGGRTASMERSPLGLNDRKESPTSTSRTKDRDEDVSLKMREMDQKEEDERGRSRSRQRRRDDHSLQSTGAAASARSSSRSSKIAEATEAAAIGARERGRDGSGSKERTDNVTSPSRSRNNGSDDRNIPATLEDDGDEEEEEEEKSNSYGLLSPSSAATKVNAAGGLTPTFIPSTSTKGLVAIPEAEELSLPPSESSRTASPNLERRDRERTKTTESEREEDAPFEMDEDVDVDFLDISSRPIFQQQPPDFAFAEDSVRSPGSSAAFRPGSYQRASALSASYAALLSTSASTQAQNPPSLSVEPSSTSPSSTRTPLNGAFSPTAPPSSSTSHRAHPMTTSVREDVGAREVDPEGGSRTAPDPRDVRRGEQKIRDVLAMDVPSHRRALPRKGDEDRSPGLTPSGSDEEEQDEGEESEDGDRVRNLATPPPSKFQVGSLPISLAGRPSNQAMSSWRPDPEREWVAEREKRGTASQAIGRPSREGTAWVPPSVGAAVSTTEDSSTPRVSETSASAVPLEIGKSSQGEPSTSRAPVASSLAQSLRNTTYGSFSARAERETPGSNAAATSEQLHVPSEEDEDEDEEEDDGVFLPPHLVADRRARKDEKYLSRSVSQS